MLSDPAWLAGHLGDSDLVLVDCDHQYAYRRLHLPGAVLSPCRYWKEGGTDTAMLAMEDPSELLGSLGISRAKTVVAYDNSGGLFAARLGWTLERFGHRAFKLLDGGLTRWYREGHPLTRDVPRVEPVAFVPDPPDDGVLARLGDLDRGVLWDVRSPKEWKAGRIPGAVHTEWSDLLDGEVLLPLETLRERLAALGVTPDQEVTTYCQGGIRAAHSYLVLRLLGYPRVRVFDGSWREYAESGLPVER